MSYSVTVELSPHADEAKTVILYTRNAAGVEQSVGWLHESHPKAVVSVPPGCVLVIADNAIAGKSPPFKRRDEGPRE